MIDPDGEFAFFLAPAAPYIIGAVAVGVTAVATDWVVNDRGTQIANAITGLVSKNEGVRGTGVRPTDKPVDLPEQLAGEEILGELANGGGEDISEGMGDPRYNPETGTHDKVRGSHTHSDGTVTEVHGDRNRETGELSDTKFKDPPDNNRSRDTLYPD